MKISKKSMVFDIIYNPKNTKLLNNSKKLGLKTSNGIKMNTIQADIALNMLLKNLWVKYISEKFMKIV